MCIWGRGLDHLAGKLYFRINLPQCSLAVLHFFECTQLLIMRMVPNPSSLVCFPCPSVVLWATQKFLGITWPVWEEREEYRAGDIMTPRLTLRGRILSAVRHMAHCAAKINLPVLWEVAYGAIHDHWLSSTAWSQTLAPLEASHPQRAMGQLSE